MNEEKLIKYLLTMLIVISTTMAVWTLNYITTSNTAYIQSAISAFNG